jgi:hypothetical protein
MATIMTANASTASENRSRPGCNQNRGSPASSATAWRRVFFFFHIGIQTAPTKRFNTPGDASSTNSEPTQSQPTNVNHFIGWIK